MLQYVISGLLGVAIGLVAASAIFAWRRRQRNHDLGSEATAAWVSAIATSGGATVAFVALSFSNYYAALSNADAHLAAEATLKQVQLEQSPVLTQDCQSARAAGWTIARAYAPNFPGSLNGEFPFWVSGLNGNFVFCTIHNYSRLPVIDLSFEFGYSPCSGFTTKTATITVPVIAAGGEARILLANQSENSSFTVLPLITTKFVMPPDQKFVPYSYPRFQPVLYELGAAPSPSPAPGQTAQPLRPYNYCKTIMVPQWVEAEKHFKTLQHSFRSGQIVKAAMQVSFPFGTLSADEKCPDSEYGNPRPTGPPIYGVGRSFVIVRLSKDGTMATLRGPQGGIVCAPTAELQHTN